MSVSLVRPTEPTIQKAPAKIEKASYGVKLWNKKCLKLKGLEGKKLSQVATVAKNIAKVIGKILLILPSLLATIVKSTGALAFNGIIRPLKNRSIKKQIANIEAKHTEAKAQFAEDMTAFKAAEAKVEVEVEAEEAPAIEVAPKASVFTAKRIAIGAGIVTAATGLGLAIATGFSAPSAVNGFSPLPQNAISAFAYNTSIYA